MATPKAVNTNFPPWSPLVCSIVCLTLVNARGRVGTVSYDKDEFQKGEDNIKEKSLEPSQDLSKYEHISHTQAREIQCFKCLGKGHLASQCPNERTMILRNKDEYSSKEKETSESEENEKKKRNRKSRKSP